MRTKPSFFKRDQVQFFHFGFSVTVKFFFLLLNEFCHQLEDLRQYRELVSVPLAPPPLPICPSTINQSTDKLTCYQSGRVEPVHLCRAGDCGWAASPGAEEVEERSDGQRYDPRVHSPLWLGSYFISDLTLMGTYKRQGT